MFYLSTCAISATAQHKHKQLTAFAICPTKNLNMKHKTYNTKTLDTMHQQGYSFKANYN